MSAVSHELAGGKPCAAQCIRQNGWRAALAAHAQGQRAATCGSNRMVLIFRCS